MKSYKLPVQVDKGPKSDAANPTLVLLHGLGNNYKSWSYVLDQINYRTQRVIALDLLGFGDAPKPSSKDCEYTPEVHADAVIAALDKLKVKEVVIAGHSMGCIVAVAVAKKRPDLVKRLVLLGPPLYKKLPHGSIWDKLWHTEGAYFTIFSAIAKSPDMTITAAKAVDVLAPLLKGMEITDETWPAFRQSLRNTIMQIQTYQDLCALQIPTLLVHGKLDFFVIKRNLKRIAKVNRHYMVFKSMLGPHEITPLQGKTVAESLQTQGD
jgi:pimeloyl-ACP methyl ester carboxylesterase